MTALLLGIAIDQRFIKNSDASVEEYWKESRGTAIGSVPITDVLTMRSGLAAFDADPLSPGQEDKLDEAPDPLVFILNIPRSDDPGTAYRYNSVTASVAGIVVAKATGRKMESFAKEKLFAPLGIKNWQWVSDAGGFTKGQGNLSLTLRDFAAIGELVRNGGRYHGRQIVSNKWIKYALSPRVHISAVDPYADDYGYFWYHKTQMVSGRPVSVWFASGNGGNKIYVIPDRAMVMTITSSAYGRGYGQKRSEDMLKAVLASPADHHCPSA